MKRVARTIKERLPNMVSDCTHRITNAAAKGINSTTMSIKRRDSGYRDAATEMSRISKQQSSPTAAVQTSTHVMPDGLPIEQH
jgi:hypothetical protein